ncbi:hypothetical protein [Paenibacillus glycanilyticus]|uniref:hypothetical protein n=1 Tax=Paenibacillus glycanilyticus TaxID=126569 RepID=UPI003EB905FF
MNPVIGVDISKGESHAQAFLKRGLPYGKVFKFQHNLEGLAPFLEYIRDVESAAGILSFYVSLTPLPNLELYSHNRILYFSLIFYFPKTAAVCVLLARNEPKIKTKSYQISSR